MVLYGSIFKIASYAPNTDATIIKSFPINTNAPPNPFTRRTLKIS